MKYRTKLFNEDFPKLTHYLFRYPAKFHPPVARFLIETFSTAGMSIIDPFCGSGTLLVEGVVADRKMFGIDLDPVACFVSKVKSTPIREHQALSKLRTFADSLASASIGTKTGVWEPAIPNLGHWFEPHVMRQMAHLWDEISTSRVLDSRVRPIAQIAFLGRVRNWSNADPVPVSGLEVTKHIRALRKDGHNPNVKADYIRALKRTIDCVEEFSNLAEAGTDTAVVVHQEAKAFFRRTRRKFDALITSPPYLTAVDYYRRHTLEMYWLDRALNPAARKLLKNQYIGQYQVNSSMREAVKDVPLSPALERRAARVSEKSAQRANAFLHYFRSMKAVLAAASARLTPNGLMVLVIGDGHIGGAKANTGRLLANEIAEFAELREVTKYPVTNRYMTYSRKNEASIEIERVYVFRNRAS